MIFQVPVTPPPEVNILWSLLVAAITGGVVLVMKKASAKVATLPDFARTLIAGGVALVVTKLSVLVGVPIPQNLTGAAGVLVNWGLAMGLHAGAKAVGLPVGTGVAK